MEKFEVTKDQAVAAYKTMMEATAMLANLIGKKNLITDVRERIKTFEDACESLNLHPKNPLYSAGSPDDNAFQRLKVIVRALNEGWTPDWNNGSEYKWYPWFYMDKPGFRFLGSYCTFTFTFTGLSSRLCLKSEALATYSGKQFLEEYRAFLC